MKALEFRFLTDGGQAPDSVTAELSAFIARASQSLDVAIYDFHARHGSTAGIATALEEAVGRGVTVRVVFNSDHVAEPGAPRPMAGDPALIDGLEVPTRAARGEGTLMHHKYVVRDGLEVWTGSTNWTDDAFSREENVVLRVASPEIASAFSANFSQLWETGLIDHSGGSGPEVSLEPGVTAQPFFSPKGRSLAHIVAERLGSSPRRVRLLSPLVTSGPILGTLAELAGRHSFDLVGAYDRTQMDEVIHEWRGQPQNAWKIEAWQVIAARLSGKASIPYRRGSVHDYMHAKAIVVDGDLLSGSYNCSRHGEGNAENLLHISGGESADQFAAFAEAQAQRYA
jgi:phosphatidylserine/phosphatidylglycerophosphate/cardiolipin synthase-like enzyme